MGRGDAGDGPQRVALQICVGVGGCAALSWEVLWQIQSSLALGVSARGTAITLATTMAGMGAGALLGGRWLGRAATRRPTRLYGRLELAIGLAGLALPGGFALLERLDGWLYGAVPALAPLVHALGIALLLGVPTLAMGATVPVFAGLAARYGTPLSRLYAVNTAGAAIGVLAFTFAVLPALGVAHTVLAIAGLNLAVFAAAHLLREPAAPPVATPETAPAAPRSAPEAAGFGAGRALLIAAGTGFVTFGLEVAWFRALRATFQSSADSFAIILASVLIPLALGARLVPVLRRWGLAPASLLAVAGVAILLATPLVERMDLWVAYLPGALGGADGYLLEQIGRFALALAVLGPPILALGTALPWLLDAFPAPATAGRLYGANTVGAAAGSLLAAWVALPALGFAQCAWILGALTVGLALAASAGRARGVVAVAGAAALVLAVTTTSSVGRDRVVTRYDWPSYRILAFEEGPDSTVSVVEQGGGKVLLIDGFAASGEHMKWGDYMDRMGRLPMLVHGDARDALVIGFGTGQTAHGVRDVGPRRLDVVELNPAVLAAAPHFETNHGVLDDPVVRATVMDGRAWLRRSDARYDVITLEPMPPHFAGVNALYSRDFYEILARRLAPGGIACQWVPLHLLPPHYAASVVRTFQAVFPDAELWVVPNVQGILLGRRPGGDGARGFSLPPGYEALAEEATPRLGRRVLARYGADGDVISDDNQLLAYGRVSAALRLYGAQEVVIQRNFARIRRLARLPE